MKRLILIAAAAAAALASACSQEPQAPATDSAPSAATDAKMADAAMPAGKMDMMAPAAGDTEATRGYKAAMMEQMHGIPAFGGDPDIDFMKQMRGHHQAAIAMARVELAQGDDAPAKALAQEIITAQQREIGVIDAWLAAKGG